MRRKGFTLIELMVAVGILAIVMVMTGAIFKAAIQSYRVATANAEIIRKYRTITDQLDRDFQGLRKDGEIFIVWDAIKDANVPNTEAEYTRFDRIMFFATGQFRSYEVDSGVSAIEGNLARISYSLAKVRNPGGGGAYRDSKNLPARQRILARTQHILQPSGKGIDLQGLTPDSTKWSQWHNLQQLEPSTLLEWTRLPQEVKYDALSVIADVNIDISVSSSSASHVRPESKWRGTQIDPCDPQCLHLVLCEGVGQFSVQGWYEQGKRWIPQIDMDGDGKIAKNDSDFLVDPDPDPDHAGNLETGRVPGVLYPADSGGAVVLGGVFSKSNFKELLSEESFNQIPGLGRALKFQFTLYDSKGIIKEGRTFTHIVYLDR